VNVRLDERGNPDFTIVEGVAYDFMEPEASWLEAARASDALCFGTLAQRNDRSRKTIQHILEAAADAVIIYDVNLRQHFYSARIIRESLARATVLKLNEQEVLDMRGILAAEGAPDAFLRGLMQHYGIQLVCVTRGAGGCTLYGAEGVISRPVPPTDVVDSRAGHQVPGEAAFERNCGGRQPAGGIRCREPGRHARAPPRTGRPV